jgi:hypothetical protein
MRLTILLNVCCEFFWGNGLGLTVLLNDYVVNIVMEKVNWG